MKFLTLLDRSLGVDHGVTCGASHRLQVSAERQYRPSMGRTSSLPFLPGVAARSTTVCNVLEGCIKRSRALLLRELGRASDGLLTRS